MSHTLLFYDPQFPFEGEARPVPEELGRLGRVVDAGELVDKLNDGETQCLIMLHGSYFPKNAWTAILSYLLGGGSLVHLGGGAFRQPVRLDEHRGFVIENIQTAYHRCIHIHEMLPVRASGVTRLRANPDRPLFAGHETLLDPADTWNMVPHVTKSSDHPHEMGSSGPMDARIHAMLTGLTEDGRQVAAPAVLWEHTGGDFKGSRWLFVNQQPGERFWTQGGYEALARWASYCSLGVTELTLKPGYACYEPGERAMLTLQTQSIRRSAAAERCDSGQPASSPSCGHDNTDRTEWTFELAISQLQDGRSLSVWKEQLTLSAERELNIRRISVPAEVYPGMYEVVCQATSEFGEVQVLRQAYWGRDDHLLKEGESVRCGRDYFEKDGRPLPVVGMTYMASDVARKFLFLPNAAIWDRDMGQMRRAGINWIRTGIWTAYRHYMQVDGQASEEALRAIDAFLLTAKKHDLQVTFTFFSFTPELWEGVNPYCDPRSLEAQKRFIRSIVSRHRTTSHVDWDLINEPSYTDPERIFAVGPRSKRDPFEQKAFVTWLEERHGRIDQLQERWNMTPAELPSFGEAAVPDEEDINFDIQDMRSGKRGTRWLDYVLFSMEMHNRWAKQLVSAIKELSPGHLVTIGQDEALRDQRPSPFFYGEEVDYTTVHSWWLNDHLVWDGVFAKRADKPNLVQETGIMYVETPDGRAKRSEEELRNLLERKYAYAFATGGAGAVQWIWNTNYYMDNANESHIGALRADGTEKPEAEVSYDFGEFIGKSRDLFKGRELEDIAIVFPYTNDFSNRRLAFDATTRLTRTLAYELKAPLRAVSAYDLEPLASHPARLILLPSPHNLEDATLKALLDIVRSSGSTLLATGPLGLDAYWQPSSRPHPGAKAHRLTNVSREESLELGGKVWSVSFGARRIAELNKEVPEQELSGPSRLLDIPIGEGRLLWCPLPIELNERSDVLAELYRHAMTIAGCSPELEWLEGGQWPGVYGRKLQFAQGALLVFVSESGTDHEVSVRDPITGVSYCFLLPSQRSVLFTVNEDGGLQAVYRPSCTTITTRQSKEA